MTTAGGKKKRVSKAPPSVPHKPLLLDWLQDPRNAAAYLEAAFEEGDVEGLMQAMRNVAEARGGIARVANKTGLSRETLYRTLSERGNPQLHTLAVILGATGLRLSVKPVESRARKAA